MHLLRSQYPEMSGLQDVVRQEITSRRSGFQRLRGDGVQILHINRNHWATMEAKDGQVFYYDSLSPSKLDRRRTAIISKLSPNPPSIRKPQQQQGGDDCGLFAIAFAEAICRGVRPELLRFDQSQMREHLLSCFRNQKLTPFPLLD